MIDNKNVEMKLERLNSLLMQFIDSIDIKGDNIRLSIPSLISIVTDTEIDIEKEKNFHGLVCVSEAKEIALICYYILRRKPIVVDGTNDNNANLINEKFCAYLLLGSLMNIEHIDKSYVDFLVSMLYKGELSKDAIYLLATTLKTVDK